MLFLRILEANHNSLKKIYWSSKHSNQFLLI